MPRQRAPSIVGKIERAAGAPSVSLEKVLGQREYVVTTKAQRWHVHWNHRQAKEQILAKASLFYFAAEVSVRRRHDAHVDLAGPISAHPQHLSFLQRIGEEMKKPLDVSPEALALLEKWRWPGNVRELENVLRRAAVFAKGAITPADIGPPVA